MRLFKQVFFGPFLVLASFILFWEFRIFLQNPSDILSLQPTVLNSFFLLIAFFLLTAFFFAILVTLAQQVLIIVIFSVLASLPAFFLIPGPDNLFLSIGYFLALGFIFLLLNNQLKTYLSFHPTSLLVPSMKNLLILLIILFSLFFYLSSQSQIKQSGFSLPDSLLNSVLDLMPLGQLTNPNSTGLSLSGDEINSLKSNPEILQQFGINPSSLNSLQTPSQTPDLKPLLKQQLNAVIKPYLSFIPLLLTLLFFLSCQSLTSLLSPLLTLLTWALFEILEKIGFTQFSKEMREVKKLIV